MTQVFEWATLAADGPRGHEVRAAAFLERS